jgi:phenylacetate-CoA ligase
MANLEATYARLPISLQNLFVSVKGLQFLYKRSHPELIQKRLKHLLETQWWSLEEFERYQTEQLQSFLSGAFEHVPYYRELSRSLGCSAQDFRSPADIRLLPVLEKSRLRGQELEFVDARYPLGKLSVGATSGTTGTPIRTYETTESMSERLAFVARLRTIAGISDPINPRRAQFTGRAIVPTTQAENVHVYWRMNAPGKALLFSTTHISEVTAPAYAEALLKYEPELIDSYPSSLLILARLAKQQNLKLPTPKAIIVSAETLLHDHRKEIEAAFQCKVYDQYASSEPSCFWFDCEHGNMHQSPEYGISEVLDAAGTQVGPMQEGEVVVTSFLNPAMPLIRYRVGDVATLGPEEACPCGRKLPRVEKVEGRRDDILYVPERGYVGRMDPVFKGIENITEAQIIQESLDKIVVLLVPAPGYTPDIGAHLLENIRQKVGNRVNLELQQVQQIPRGPNGKFRSVISRCRDQYPTQMS